MFFHGKKKKKKTIKGIGQAFYPSILVRYINFQVSFWVIEDTFLHHLRQMLLTFFLISTLTITIGMYFYVISINSFENNNTHFSMLVFHGKKKPLKELVKHSTLQSLLDTSTSKFNFLVVKDVFLHYFIRQMLLTFVSFLHWLAPLICIFMLLKSILLKTITFIFQCLFFHGKKKPLKELAKHFTIQSLLDTSTSKLAF